jgi:hypothetical protein
MRAVRFLQMLNSILLAAVLAAGPFGAVPAGMPSHLGVGLGEQNGQTWMKTSGVPWDFRYAYLTQGWTNNWGWGANDGTFALGYMNDSAAAGAIPVLTWYEMNGYDNYNESAFLSTAQNATAMAAYFADFKLLLQNAKNFGKPVVIHVEPDGFGFLEQQSGGNSSAAAAVASTGMPELAALPNTVAGWGLAFLALRKSVGASNVILAMHISDWATGTDLMLSSTAALQPIVDQAYAFLSPLGLAANQTGATWDVVVGDPLDRDADYYLLTQSSNKWWTANDSDSINSQSFNRYAEWLRLWNVESGKRWLLWQIPCGNSNHLDVYNNGASQQGYKDNRAEYFFLSGTAHAQKFAQVGVTGLLFGAGASGMSTYQNDTYTDGRLFLKSRAGAFYTAGGVTLPAAGSTAPSFTASATASPASVVAGATTTFSATVTDSSGTLANGVVNLNLENASGAQIAQQSSSAQSFTAGQSHTYSWTYTAPATAGTYSLAIGVYSSDQSSNYFWNGAAATLTVTAKPAGPQYDFESATQGWISGGAPIKSVSTSATQHFSGLRSLAVSFTGTAAGQQSVYVANPATAAGKLVTFHVWIPAWSKISAVQPYALQGASGGWAWSGNWQAIGSLKTGAWNTLTVQLPANATALAQLGVQFTTSAAWTGTAYVDSVAW